MREPRRITHIEVSEKNKKLRMVLIVVLLAVAVTAITVGITTALNKDTGWQPVRPTLQERNCSEQFALQYNFTGSGAEATALNRKLEAAYGQACVKAYQLFTPDEAIVGVNNLYHINHNPGQEIALDPVLYDALAKLEPTGYLYLGPVFTHYDNIFFRADESYVAQLDPVENPEEARYLAQLAAFAADREAVKLDFLGENKVKLTVSPDYAAFAGDHEIEDYLGFGFLTNAFIIDYLADTLVQEGLTQGFLVSVDGFTRNLDSTHSYNLNLYDKVGDTVYPAAVMQYRGPVSIVYAKSYPITGAEPYYRASGDHIVCAYVDPADGMYKTSVPNLVSYSYTDGCADVLLRILPVFATDAGFTVPQGVYSIWFEGRRACYNDPSVILTDLLNQGNVTYSAHLQG